MNHHIEYNMSDCISAPPAAKSENHIKKSDKNCRNVCNQTYPKSFERFSLSFMSFHPYIVTGTLFKHRIVDKKTEHTSAENQCDNIRKNSDFGMKADKCRERQRHHYAEKRDDKLIHPEFAETSEVFGK